MTRTFELVSVHGYRRCPTCKGAGDVPTWPHEGEPCECDGLIPFVSCDECSGRGILESTRRSEDDARTMENGPAS
jgi:DnaJ-class molecular chaperone